jgi:F-type H+-transporting ATPase subunit b
MAETTHAGTEVPAGEQHGGGAFPPFASETFLPQLIWLAIAFGLLYFLMSRVALPRVAGILETRGERIAADLEAAQRMKAESDASVEAYEASLAEARNRALAIAAETRDAVTRDMDVQRKSVESELAGRLAAAESQIAATKSAALSNVRGIASEAATAIVVQLTGRVPEAAGVAAAVDAALKDGARQ